MAVTGLFGDFYVVPTSGALAQAWSLCQKSARPYHILRRHTLKLAFWPDGSDTDWDWIKTLEPQRIGELRIDDEIAGNNNIRIIFFKANIALKDDPVSASGEIMRRIWILAAFQKKAQGFSSHQMKAWKGTRTILVQRYYNGATEA